MIITSSPCLPKASFHCGNAISSLSADLISRCQKEIRKGPEPLVIPTPWNLHGLPYERLYMETYGREGSYEDILSFTKDYVAAAAEETAYFLHTGEHIGQHSDTDSDFVAFTEECFVKLIEMGYVVKAEEVWYIDTKRLLQEYEISSILERVSCYPEYHRASIIKEQKTFDNYYPISKHRVFTAKACYKGETICINPIFQSFIYPLYLAQQYGEKCVFAFTGGSGFSSLKWHYYRQLISVVLTNNHSVDTIFLHGTILGDDRKPMSKHSSNTLHPSDLYRMQMERNFVRYVLIRSISDNNIPIQLEKAVTEYKKIKRKLLQIQNTLLKPVPNGKEGLLQEAQKYLTEYRFNLALETFYVYLKGTQFSEEGDEQVAGQLKLLFRIFFDFKE